MKSRTLFELLLLLLILETPAAVQGGEKVHSRGWIGGEYRLARRGQFFQPRDVVSAFPVSLTNQQKRGIYVAAVPTNTPAANAGLEPGDLILQADDRVVDRLKDWRRMIDESAPGRLLPLTVWRLGELKQLNLVVGRENYRHTGSIGLGIYLSSRLDAIPNPNFSLVALGFRRDSKRVELHSPKQHFIRAAGKKNPHGPDPAGAVQSREGWSAWVTPFHFGYHRSILSQETVAKETARVELNSSR